VRIRFAALLLGFAVAACDSDRAAARKAIVEDMAQTLRNEVAGGAAPESKQGEIESGATAWRSSFTETAVRTEKGITTRSFILQLRNRASSPQRFRGVVRYFDSEGAEVRRRDIPLTVVEPFSTQEIGGSLAVPETVNARIAQVLPEIERVPFETDEY
jgi:hypothetical protein